VNIELQVIGSALSAVAEEMGAALVRSAFSANIKERRDCSTALFAADGRMIAQAEHIPVHLGAMPEAVAAVMRHDPRPGDVWILNDPYSGGTHLPDITLVSRTILGFAVTRAHHADVGGREPGSLPADSTTLEEEGVVIPPTRLDDHVLACLVARMRNPDERRGDLRAQLAAHRLAERRISELCARRGRHRVAAAMDELYAYSERRVRTAIAALPDGRYEAADVLEAQEGDLAIRAEVAISGDEIEIDFSGTAPQHPGNLNCPLAVTRSAAYFVVRCVTDPDVPASGGAFAPVTVLAPEGSLVNARPPAAVAAGNVETSCRVADVLFAALAQAVPVPAQGQGTMNNLTVGNERFTYYETIGGGQGACPDADGPSAVHVTMSNTRSTPVEALELAHPLRVRRYALRVESGGEGAQRGGDGVVRELEALESCRFSIVSERRAHAPKGARGGGPGRPGRNLLNGTEIPAKATGTLTAGDVLTIETPGGGGWGRWQGYDPRVRALRCRGWEQEGALRCLLNNLDPAVAEDPSALVVYGGRGRAARGPEALAEIVAALERLRSDETLIVQSGKAVAVLPTHEDAPRVLISTAMVVPEWSDQDTFRRLEDAGLTMYGQMTAAGWFYIGTQGILGFTYETFRAVAREHFGGSLAGRRVLTAGLGGMGGAQGFGVTLNGGRALIVEVDPARAKRRLADGWVDLVGGYDEALAAHLAPDGPGAVALVGNAADVVPRLLGEGVGFDVVTDQTAAHDPLRGYVPRGYGAQEAAAANTEDPAFQDAVFGSLAVHVEALLGYRERGAVVFEYGNGIRAQAAAHGVPAATEIPGFVSAYVRPIFARGVGPFRWICLSGDPEDLRRSEDALLKVAGTDSLQGWIELARERVPLQGLPARICWLGLGERDRVALALNELVRSGQCGPLALGRDHMDPASVASPTRETEGMLDGSDTIADWPVLSALLNAAQGASWVAIGNGGGVGVGRSVHSGMVVVADGSDLAERKLRRIFWSDPALGVARYADAGYPDALELLPKIAERP
jgi:urocanate hydratase